ncbi:sensor histidine kinase [Paenibacillus yanchengensis]|uniref:Sensor histidine kinase n=1 Tax=Paenibacillus yanchengensis TaxID=2035833 RepID=A0ABW4YPK4_9BACL
MNKWFERFKYNGLFIKMFFIMVISIVLVAVTTTWTTINMSERLFMDTFSITNSKIINQINENLESFHYSIVVAANNVSQSGAIREFLMETEGNSLEVLSAHYRMNELMQRIVPVLDMYDIEVFVTGINGRIYAGSDRSLLKFTGEEIKQHAMTMKTVKNPQRVHYNVLPRDEKMNENVIVITKALIDRNTGLAYGVLYLSISEKNFSEFFDSYANIGNEVVVLHQDGTVLSSDNKLWIGQKDEELLYYVENLEKQEKEYYDVKLKGKQQIVLAKYLPTLDAHIVNIIDKKIAIGKLTDMDAIVLTVLLIVLVALIILFFTSRQLTLSLSRLVKQISNISKFGFAYKVAVSGNYETKQLGQAFNHMLGELQEHVNQLMETQKQQRNAELEALQGQINPHFLYNTLASIKFMVQQGGKEKALDTINALISLLQNIVGNANETISLSQELVNTKNYVMINQARYGEKIKMNYFVMPDCLGYHLPKLIVQPFIENAFFHAFSNKGEGNIYFMAAVDGDSLVCEIADDGDGFEVAALDQQQLALEKNDGRRQLFTGIGVQNVQDRLQLLYGEPYGVTITSKLGEGTKVKICLPLIKDEMQ